MLFRGNLSYEKIEDILISSYKKETRGFRSGKTIVYNKTKMSPWKIEDFCKKKFKDPDEQFSFICSKLNKYPKGQYKKSSFFEDDYEHYSWLSYRNKVSTQNIFFKYQGKEYNVLDVIYRSRIISTSFDGIIKTKTSLVVKSKIPCVLKETWIIQDLTEWYDKVVSLKVKEYKEKFANTALALEKNIPYKNIFQQVDAIKDKCLNHYESHKDRYLPNSYAEMLIKNYILYSSSYKPLPIYEKEPEVSIQKQNPTEKKPKTFRKKSLYDKEGKRIWSDYKSGKFDDIKIENNHRASWTDTRKKEFILLQNKAQKDNDEIMERLGFDPITSFRTQTSEYRAIRNQAKEKRKNQL